MALNGTATFSTAATATRCTDTYTILAGDSCNPIAKAENVPTFSPMYTNNLEAYCADFPAVGLSVCLPGQCDDHTVVVDDMSIYHCGRIWGHYSNATVLLISEYQDRMRKFGSIGRYRDMHQSCRRPSPCNGSRSDDRYHDRCVSLDAP